jgi:hypothetical protein
VDPKKIPSKQSEDKPSFGIERILGRPNELGEKLLNNSEPLRGYLRTEVIYISAYF